jgi:uncharacterized protein (TIGR02246 family)
LVRSVHRRRKIMPERSLPNEDIEAIMSVFKAVAQYLQAGDFRSWAAQFAEDGVLMPPNSPVVQGGAAIREYGEAFPKIRKISFSDVGVEGHGDLAVGWSAIRMTLVPEGAEEIKDTGKQLVLLRKHADGKWFPTRVMFNSDLALG